MQLKGVGIQIYLNDMTWWKSPFIVFQNFAKELNDSPGGVTGWQPGGDRRGQEMRLQAVSAAVPEMAPTAWQCPS